MFECAQSLKVECCKLRARVVEVQQQNDELRRLFCDRARYQLNSDDDIMAVKNLQVSLGTSSIYKMTMSSFALTLYGQCC